MRLLDQFPPLNVKDRDDVGSNPSSSPSIREVLEARFGRRVFLRGATATLALGALDRLTPLRAWAEEIENPSTLTFEELEHGIDEKHHVAKGYSANVLIRWGDKIGEGSPDFNISKLGAELQENQFGYNCDFIAYMPLPAGSSSSDSGLLCVNHEYTNAELMFPGLTEDNRVEKLTKQQVEIEMAAHGHSVIELRRSGNKWQVVTDSRYSRRISANTPMEISGPAAGHDRLKTSADPTGKAVIGTFNNCAGGQTPWNTVLMAEENFNFYFGNVPEKSPQAAAYKRYGIVKDSEYAWSKYHDRFNVAKEPNESNRFGWIVEYDPYDASSMPVKRTALGRFKHEGATSIVNKDGRVVIYSGDDERFDYLYKFVTIGTFNPGDRAANLNLLDEGTLYVAKFLEDGKLNWLALKHGDGPLTEANGFGSQGDVLIEARRAADLLGATPMDRPEDIEPNPATGKVYAAMTNNDRRKIDRLDKANPRFDNRAGHIIEMSPPGEGKDADHAASEFTWSHFIIAGDPTWGATLYGEGTSETGWFAAPDGLTVDRKGRLWIASDQGSSQPNFKIGDGVWACDTTGKGRAVTRFFFRCPADAEMAGLTFTPDYKALFVSVQHPAEGSTFDKPSTRWPDFAQAVPPRPSVVVITKDDGGEIGG
jgi:secreted PhoX family phosphatase